MTKASTPMESGIMARRRLMAGAAGLLATLSPAAAQPGWPSRPVRLLVGQPAGAGTDLLARGLAPHLVAAFGQPFVVENRPGAGGNIAAAAVAQATDGHTLGIVLGGPTTTARALNPALPYDPARDFRAVSLLTRVPFVLVVPQGLLPLPSLPAWIDHVRAHPGQLSYASIGPGTVTHLAMEELKARLGIDLVHIPYRGFPPGTLDLVAGRVQAMFTVPSEAVPQLADRRLVALAQTGPRRLSQLPDVPTLEEAGLPDAGFFGWAGLVAPRSFPAEVAEQIASVIKTALETHPASRGGLDRVGNEILGAGPADLSALQEQEAARWNAVIERLALRSTD